MKPCRRRVASPPGVGSTLTTSAPRSASSMPALRPMIVWQNSSTRIPARSGISPVVLTESSAVFIVQTPTFVPPSFSHEQAHGFNKIRSCLGHGGQLLAQTSQAAALHHGTGKWMADDILGQASTRDQRLQIDAGLDAH